MPLAYALPKTGHPNCRRPDKVIDAGQWFHVIENDHILRQVMNVLITTKGYKSLSFESAESYLDFYSLPQYTAPAAIIIDNEMSGMSGNCLIKHIRKDTPFQKIAIITTILEDIKTSRKELCYVLPKSFTLEQLELLLRGIALCEKYNLDSACGLTPKCSFGLENPCPFYEV